MKENPIKKESTLSFFSEWIDNVLEYSGYYEKVSKIDLTYDNLSSLSDNIYDDELKILETSSGYLQLLGKNQRWKRRYFTVHDGKLQYFHDHQCVQCLGSITLHKASLKRYGAEKFGIEGCWKVTQIASKSAIKESKHDLNESILDQGPFVIKTTSTQREFWIYLLDLSIYTLTVEELIERKNNQQNEYDQKCVSEPMHTETKSHDITISQNHAFVRLKYGLDEAGDNDFEPIINMFLSDNLSEIISLIEKIPESYYDRAAQAFAYVSLVISEKKVRQLVKVVAKREVDQTMLKEVLFRRDSFSSKILMHYTREIGYVYLKSMLSNWLQQIILISSKDRISFELDPLKLADYNVTVVEEKVLTNWVDSYIDDGVNQPLENLDSDTKQLMEHLDDGGQKVHQLINKILVNRKHLIKSMKEILLRITSSIDYAPRILRSILHDVKLAVNEKFPDSNWSVVGAIIFLRFICPTLSSGTISKKIMIRRTSISQLAQRNLVIVAKILQCFANRSRIKSKEISMVLLKSFFQQEMENFHNFCEQFSNPLCPELTINCISDSPTSYQTRLSKVREHFLVIQSMLEGKVDELCITKKKSMSKKLKSHREVARSMCFPTRSQYIFSSSVLAGCRGRTSCFDVSKE